MDYLKIMTTVETLSIFVCMFLITWSAGDGAPQWRPQGRFGKRFSSSRNSDIMTALRAVTDESDQLEPLLVEGVDVDMNSDILDNYFNNLQSNSQSSSTSLSRSTTGGRVCIETSVPGVFRCHRRKRSTDSVVQVQDE